VMTQPALREGVTKMPAPGNPPPRKQIYRFTDKAISQNVRLVGCICKTCQNWDNCCCRIGLVAPSPSP
jgi:hypothetical protein